MCENKGKKDKWEINRKNIVRKNFFVKTDWKHLKSQKHRTKKLISLHLTPRGLCRNHRAKLLKVLCAIRNNVRQKHHI